MRSLKDFVLENKKSLQILNLQGFDVLREGYFTADMLLNLGKTGGDYCLGAFIGFCRFICGGGVKTVFCAAPIGGFKRINCVLITASALVFIYPGWNNVHIGKGYFVTVFSKGEGEKCAVLSMT